MFFDDTAIGADCKENAPKLLDVWLETCERNNARVKLPKCEFLTEEMEYLGFVVGNNWWKPSPKKVQALQKAKITDLKSLRGFLGAANFLRRHVKNFTYASAPLTDLLKGNTRREWTVERQAAFEDLKRKISDTQGLGVPRSRGKIVLITDASCIGGGAAVFQ